MKLKNAYSTLTILAVLLPNAVFAADDSQQGHGLRGHNEQDRKLPSNGKGKGNDNGKGNDKGKGKGNGDVDGGGTPKSEPTGRVIISRKSVKKLKTRGKSDNQIAAMRAKGLTKINQKKVVFESKGEGDFQVVEVPPGTEKEFIDELLRNDVEGIFEYAEPDEIQEIVLTPNDALLHKQYHHSKMQSYDAWDLSTGLSNITIAICDTGLQLDHPDLEANSLPGYHATVQKWQDNVLDPGDVTAVHPHGTQCAGCAAAIGNNTQGLAGVGWNFKHRPGRVSDVASGSASSSHLADCARKMCELPDVKVVSVSYTGAEGEARGEAATYCKAQGALMVNAAGNDGRDLSTFGEADADDLIVVGATTSTDLKSDFSAYGRFVDVWAPGSSVWTTTTGSGYSYVSGTSFSCPLVAGLIALIWSKNPALTPDEVEAILKLSTDNPYNIQEAHNTQYGRINSFEALKAAASGTSHPTPSPTTAPPTTPPTHSPTEASFPVEPTITAIHDGTVPRCTLIGGACSSGTLLNGRGTLGPESNTASNTIDTCSDGNKGSYLSDESNEAIEVFAANGGLLRVGKMAKIRATVFAWSTGSSDTADFYVTDGDSNPTWVLIGSKTPLSGGAQVIESDPFELTSTLQTVRVQFRYGGSAGSCVTGAYNDMDDLVFAVEAEGTTPNPTQGTTPNPTQGTTPNPTQGTTPNPTEQTTPNPTQGTTPNPTQGTTPNPTQGTTPNPTSVPTPNPTPVPTPNPTSVPTPNPTSVPTPNPTSVPTPNPTSPPTPKYNVVCGSTAGSCSSVPYKSASVMEPHEVRCCADTNLGTGWLQKSGCGDVWGESQVDGTCHASKTFEEATSLCSGVNARLCTKKEIMGDCTRGSGCGYDSQHVWSSTPVIPCTTDASCDDGSECTVDSCGEDGVCLHEMQPNCGNAIVCGSSTTGGCASPRVRQASPSDLHEVRCCSDTAKLGWKLNTGCTVYGESDVSGVCNRDKDLAGAEAICQEAGARLCTSTEILADCTKGSGCSFDRDHVWTSTPYTNGIADADTGGETSTGSTPPGIWTTSEATPPTGGGNNDDFKLLSIAEAVVEACDESVLAQDMSGCQAHCHDHMCCFETGKYSCLEDLEKHCLAYAGCETLVGSKW